MLTFLGIFLLLVNKAIALYAMFPSRGATSSGQLRQPSRRLTLGLPLALLVANGVLLGAVYQVEPFGTVETILALGAVLGMFIAGLLRRELSRRYRRPRSVSP